MKTIGSVFAGLFLLCNGLIAGVPTWSVNPAAYTYSMNVTCKLNINCVDLKDASDMVGAFVGGTCRGVVNSSNVVEGNYLAFLTVYSNSTSGETVEFKIYDASEDSVYDAAITVGFQNNAAYGFPTSPYTIPTNNQPTDISLSNANADENAANVFVGKLTTVDTDPQSHTYSLVAGTGDTDNASFTISNDSLYVNGTLDYEAKTSYSVRIQTSDGGCTYEEAFAISVNDLSEAPTDITLSNDNIDENLSVNSAIGTFSTVDADQSDTHTYTLVAGAGDTDNGKVLLSTSGVLTSKVIYDHETQDTLFIRVKSKDSGNNTIEEAFVIAINDANDAPTNIQMSTYNFYENQATGTTIATYSSTDQDAGDVHSYSFFTTPGSDNAQFTIVGNTVRSNAKFDYETKNIYYTYVETNDGNGGTYNRQLIINILDTNDAPTDIAISNLSIEENKPAGTFIGVISSTDEDAGESHTYSLVSGVGADNNASFSISNDSLFSNAIFEFETKSSYKIRVQTNDGLATFQEAFTVTIIDANDAPTDISLSDNEIAENQQSGSVVATISSADVDAGDSHTYSLVTGTGDTDNSKFKISGAQLQSAAKFDFETQDTMYIRLQTKDGSGLTYQKQFTIVVTNGNDAPTDISLSTDTFNENLVSGTTILTFSTIDQDAADSHIYSFDNNQSSDNASFTIAGNSLKTNGAFDYETKNLYVIRIQTKDVSGSTFVEQFVLHVADSNDVPTALKISNASAFENSALGTYVGKFFTTDADGTDNHTYSLTSGANSTDNGSFSISNDSLFTNTLFVYNVKNKYFIRAKTTDKGSLSYEQEFVIFIKNSNDAPTDIMLSSDEVAENLSKGAIVGTISTADVDSGDGHTYRLVAGTGDADNASFAISNDKLITNAKFDYETKDTFSIRIETSDIAGLTYQEQVNVIITDANDVPTNIVLDTDSFAENLAQNSVIINLSTVDQDAANVHSYSFDNSQVSDNALFTIVGSTVRTNADFNFEQKSVYYVYITTNDGNVGVFTKQFALYVKDGNDGPTALALSGNKVTENNPTGTYVGKFSTTDEDAGDSFTYTLTAGTGSGDNAHFSISNDSLFMNTTADFEAKNKYSILVKTTDAGGKATTQQFNIDILDGNDGPTDIDLDDNEVAEKLAKGTPVGKFATTDVDAGDVHQYSLVAGSGDTDNAKFKISGNQLLTNAVFDFETKDTLSVRIQTKDKGDSTFTKVFTVIVTNANDAPTDIVLDTDTFSENLSFGASIITLSTVDEDTADTHFYQFDNTQANDNNLFTIVGDKIKTNASFNYEVQNLYIIYVTTNDGSNGTYTRQFVLHVRDENDAPTAQTISSDEVAENNSGKAFVGILSTTDEDAGESFTYSLVSGTGDQDNGSFSVSNDSLYVTTVLNFEAKAKYYLRIKTSDAGGKSIESQYEIRVTDNNDEPTALSLALTELNENNTNLTVVGNFSTTDEDISDNHTYTLVVGTGDDDNSVFIISGNELKINAVTNFETKSSYFIRVQTNDGNGGTLQETFTIDVNDVNEEPVISDISFEVSETAAVNDEVGTLTVSDEDASDSHTFTIIGNVPFTMNGNSLEVKSALDYETAQIYVFQVVVTDSKGLKDTAEITVIVKDQVELDLPLPVNKIMSPNSDGINDYFVIDNADVYKDYSLKIFNNAGLVIFEVPSGYDNTWSGTYNGSLVGPGVYYYLLQSNSNPDKYFKGSFSITR